MDTEEALLLALHANPADEVAWLALADRLEEAGDARAELLRLHRELRTAPKGAGRRRAEARVRELLAGVRPCVPRLLNSIGMELVLIPAGQFIMGTPRNEEERHGDETQHEVEITRPFYLGAYQVTQAQYETVTGRNPSDFVPGTSPYGRRVAKMDTRSFPVESVSWEDAVAFCERLSALPPEKEAGRAYCLPTEAEWEYACRAWLTSGPYHFGATLSATQANIDGGHPYPPDRLDLRAEYRRRTCPVGSFPPNAWGLFDLHGNVWEWCSDWYGRGSNRRKRNPQGPANGTERVFRGGSWYCYARNCRAGNRRTYGGPPSPNMIGVRVVCRWTGSG
jgi:uncharacterized protein (TIGR02996 family)